jgi:hypothetical protein
MLTYRLPSCCVWSHQTQQDGSNIINNIISSVYNIYIYIYIYNIHCKTFLYGRSILKFVCMKANKLQDSVQYVNIYSLCKQMACIYHIYIYIYILYGMTSVCMILFPAFSVYYTTLKDGNTGGFSHILTVHVVRNIQCYLYRKTSTTNILTSDKSK